MRLVLATAFNLGISALIYAACIQWGLNGAIAVIAATVASATMWACILARFPYSRRRSDAVAPGALPLRAAERAP